ncbi:hypothetical protein [Bacillus cereus]|uniref:hypothetical protein n=1 Tax=Bacillus cereus TaxID=1396 RepID=UPI000BEC44B3|nr:hypothetical protein [Bacillus cereus]PDY16230.1 hypothetical protein COM76_24975 [Bacillus cereus]PEU54891.1 hypothetical protein CN414_17165 [Bacillus cereus]PEX72462.1 hypothetical protein CN457_28825 [Bacillus cereus]PFA76512.1 hypothetical protein CN406_19665 [Bacillus cereus]PFM55371.1 hypothetical protein COJ49_08115 [Bacillus cereus]
MLPGLNGIKKNEQVKKHIYHISASVLNTDGSLTCLVQAIVNDEIIGEYKARIQEWDQLSMMYGAFVAKVLDLTSNNTRENTLISTENTVQYIGSTIWNVIHENPRIFEIWSKWKLAVERSNPSNTVILVSGEHFNVTLPIECIRYAPDVKDFIRNYNVSILRSVNGLNSVDLLDEQLPSNIIIFLGNDDGEPLGIKNEIREWLFLLQPDREWTVGDINQLLGRGDTIYSTTNPNICEVSIIPKGDVAYLKHSIENQVKPFIFLYVGHGAYDRNQSHQDGKLLLSSTEFDWKKQYMNHPELSRILRYSNVKAVIINCCEGIRNFQVVEVNRNDDLKMEQVYFQDIKELKLLSGFRSRVSDLNAARLSIQLVSSIIKRQTFLQYNSKINHNDIFNLTGVSDQKSIRDHVSRVTIIRT